MAQKKKRMNAYQEIKKLRKALEDPEKFTIDPIKEQEKLDLKRKKREDKYLKKQEAKLAEEAETLKFLRIKKGFCLKCRKRGHLATECPENDSKKENMCYNCGSKEHTLWDCELERSGKDLPFAECFLCKERGHITAQCPQNSTGVYPKGGSCFNCGSVWHLAKDCDQRGTR